MAAQRTNYTLRRTGEPPAKHRLAIIIDTAKYPELAAWVWEHAYSGPAILREVLDRAVRSGAVQEIENQMDGEGHGEQA